MATNGDNMPVKLETWRVNVWNVLVIVGGIIVNAATAGYVWNDTQRDIHELKTQGEQIKGQFVSEASDRKDRQKGYQDTLNNMQAQISQIAPLSFQTTRALELGAENKKSIDATGERIDRVVESFGGKLDTVIENVNKVATQVQVLSSKFDDQNKPQRTRFSMQVIKPAE